MDRFLPRAGIIDTSYLFGSSTHQEKRFGKYLFLLPVSPDNSILSEIENRKKDNGLSSIDIDSETLYEIISVLLGDDILLKLSQSVSDNFITKMVTALTKACARIAYNENHSVRFDLKPEHYELVGDDGCTIALSPDVVIEIVTKSLEHFSCNMELFVERVQDLRLIFYRKLELNDS